MTALPAHARALETGFDELSAVIDGQVADLACSAGCASQEAIHDNSRATDAIGEDRDQRE
jgi:hypothetical protein